MSSAAGRPTGKVAATHDRRRRRAEDLASVTGAVAIIVGGAALLGWRLGAGTFDDLIPGLLVLYGVLAIVIWLSARNARLTEQSRQAALEELDRFFEVSSDLLATASAAGFFVRLNPAWTTLLGYDVAELCSMPFVEFVHPDDVEATNREVQRQVGAGEPVAKFQNRFRHQDGSYRWLEWSSSPSADRAWIYAVARDVTERKREEERLRAPAIALARRQAEERDRIQKIIDTHAFTSGLPADHRPFDGRLGRVRGPDAICRWVAISRSLRGRTRMRPGASPGAGHAGCGSPGIASAAPSHLAQYQRLASLSLRRRRVAECAGHSREAAGP